MARTKNGCEISIALDNDPSVTMENNLGDVRKKTEAIWSDAAKYLSGPAVINRIGYADRQAENLSDDAQDPL